MVVGEWNEEARPKQSQARRQANERERTSSSSSSSTKGTHSVPHYYHCLLPLVRNKNHHHHHHTHTGVGPGVKGRVGGCGCGHGRVDDTWCMSSTRQGMYYTVGITVLYCTVLYGGTVRRYGGTVCMNVCTVRRALYSIFLPCLTGLRSKYREFSITYGTLLTLLLSFTST